MRENYFYGPHVCDKYAVIIGIGKSLLHMTIHTGSCLTGAYWQIIKGDSRSVHVSTMLLTTLMVTSRRLDATSRSLCRCARLSCEAMMLARPRKHVSITMLIGCVHVPNGKMLRKSKVVCVKCRCGWKSFQYYDVAASAMADTSLVVCSLGVRNFVSPCMGRMRARAALP